MEERREMLELAEAEVGDGPAGDVGDAHAEQERIDVGADDDVLLVDRLGRGEVAVNVERARSKGQQAEEMVVGFGDGLARPMLEHIADLVVLEVAAEALLPG